MQASGNVALWHWFCSNVKWMKQACWTHTLHATRSTFKHVSRDMCTRMHPHTCTRLRAYMHTFEMHREVQKRAKTHVAFKSREAQTCPQWGTSACLAKSTWMKACPSISGYAEGHSLP